MTEEAIMMINGHLLTTAQSATIRVSLENFVNYLETNGLGSDEHGTAMKALYLHHIDKIRDLIFANAA